jgi:hypothetical protein
MKWLWGGSALIGELHGPRLYLCHLVLLALDHALYPIREKGILRVRTVKKKSQRGLAS